jgi:hypothetical protein
VPKGQRNTFGNYNYRSCEDILKSLTPHLKETNTILTINDSIEVYGDRFYVKALATITCCESGENHTVSAYAREPLNKKGADEAQITGATSSYARKYALSALFAIDDTKDADATNDHGKGERKPKDPTNIVPQEKHDEDDKQYKKICDTLSQLKTIAEINDYAKTMPAITKDMLVDYQEAVREAFAERRKSVSEG